MTKMAVFQSKNVKYGNASNDEKLLGLVVGFFGYGLIIPLLLWAVPFQIVLDQTMTASQLAIAIVFGWDAVVAFYLRKEKWRIYGLSLAVLLQLIVILYFSTMATLQNGGRPATDLFYMDL